MILTLQHAPPTVVGLSCGHCDEVIVAGEDLKYVRISLGSDTCNFHESCFSALLSALIKFDQVFLKDRQGEVREKKVH